MLDLIDGLPVHILVVHAVVVLIPLMALVTIAFTLRPKWRAGLGWAVLGNLVATGAAIVAKLAGENLQTRLSNQLGQPVATEHAELGDKLPYFAIALLVASVLAWALTRGTGAGFARVGTALLLVVVTGVLAGWWTFRTGDSGSRAVWQDTIANTQAP